MALHRTKRVILMVHSACGAYGGLACGFNGDTEAEARHRQQELRKAAARLSEAIPDLEIEAYFVDFNGIRDAEVSAGSPPTPETKAIA
jgi:hypothetical protein